MIFKWLKRSLIVAVVLLLVGAVVFGTEAISYISSSAVSARRSIIGMSFGHFGKHRPHFVHAIADLSPSPCWRNPLNTVIPCSRSPSNFAWLKSRKFPGMSTPFEHGMQ